MNKRSYYLVKKIYKRRSGIAVKIGEKVPFKQTPTIPIRFDNKETVIELNGMNIEAYPSHFLDAIRGLPKVYFIFLDEHPPHAPESLFERIKSQSPSCLSSISFKIRPIFSKVEKK